MVYREHVLGNRHRLWVLNATFNNTGGSRGHDRMVVEITTTCAISAHHH